MKPRIRLLAAAMAAIASTAHADVITDWNTKTSGFISDAKLGTPPAIRVMALVQTAAYHAAAATDAQNAATRGSVSVDAAVHAAHRATLIKLLPAHQPAIEAAYQAAMAAVVESEAGRSAVSAGVAAGEKAAADVLAQRADDKPGADTYRPHTSAGIYVPTAMPAVTTWSARKPWLMSSAWQFRPAAPHELDTDAWATDYNEVKAIGSKSSTHRTQSQTDIAVFWEYSLPSIYYGVVRSVADQAGRDVTRNARLYAALAQAMDDAMIGVFDAKYHYNFWRPTTAIRNGDIDGHASTERDASWTSFIDAPMHPEYPSGHGILAGVVGAVLTAEVGAGTMPTLSTTSPTAKGATRRWTTIDEFVREVGDSRVFAGIHYRLSTEVGTKMGEKIGALAVKKVLASGDATQVAAR